ncbi:MAG: PfkB family carbohydrate kinase [Puniceicoccales bacterium]|nr:PfkB family carbohydrate kinase [Puniceicoccales bacterium]
MKNLLDKISGLKVLVIGDIMLDHYIIGDVTRISPEAPVPVVAVERDKYALGAAANVALNVARLGCHTELIGTIGQDRSGEIVKNLLAENGISFNMNFVSPTTSTIKKTRVVVRGQQLCRIDREDNRLNYEMAKIVPLGEICKRIEFVDAVILSDYAKGILTNSNVVKFIEAAERGNAFIAIDPKPINKLSFSGVALMTPNMAEAMQLAGIDLAGADKFPEKKTCESILRKYSPKNLVITLGPDGMLAVGEDKKILRIPTRAREVFDVSGAGDTSIACLTLALASGESLADAAKFANIAAGIVVSKHGTAAVSVPELLSLGNEYPTVSDPA